MIGDYRFDHWLWLTPCLLSKHPYPAANSTQITGGATLQVFVMIFDSTFGTNVSDGAWISVSCVFAIIFDVKKQRNS